MPGARPDTYWRSRWLFERALAALYLLAFLGTGEHADLLAHLFGFLLGLGLGLIAALAIRRIPPAPVQWLLAAAAGATVVGAWRAAF